MVSATLTDGYLPISRTSLPCDWHYCLTTEARVCVCVCEQLAQGRYLDVWHDSASNPRPLELQADALTITPHTPHLVSLVFARGRHVMVDARLYRQPSPWLCRTEREVEAGRWQASCGDALAWPCLSIHPLDVIQLTPTDRPTDHVGASSCSL